MESQVPIIHDTTDRSWADLAVHAVDNTKVKSAGTPFAAGDVGNVLTITGGVGWTPGDYLITAGPDGGGYVTLAASPSAAGNANAGAGAISWHRVNTSGTSDNALAAWPAMDGQRRVSRLYLKSDDGSGTGTPGSGFLVALNRDTAPASDNEGWPVAAGGESLALAAPLVNVWVRKLASTDHVVLMGVY